MPLSWNEIRDRAPAFSKKRAVESIINSVDCPTNEVSGAAYSAVTAAIFEKAELLVPPLALLKRFGDATIPIPTGLVRDVARRRWSG